MGSIGLMGLMGPMGLMRHRLLKSENRAKVGTADKVADICMS